MEHFSFPTSKYKNYELVSNEHLPLSNSEPSLVDKIGFYLNKNSGNYLMSKSNSFSSNFSRTIDKIKMPLDSYKISMPTKSIQNGYFIKTNITGNFFHPQSSIRFQTKHSPACLV